MHLATFYTDFVSYPIKKEVVYTAIEEINKVLNLKEKAIPFGFTCDDKLAYEGVQGVLHLITASDKFSDLTKCLLYYLWEFSHPDGTGFEFDISTLFILKKLPKNFKLLHEKNQAVLTQKQLQAAVIETIIGDNEPIEINRKKVWKNKKQADIRHWQKAIKYSIEDALCSVIKSGITNIDEIFTETFKHYRKCSRYLTVQGDMTASIAAYRVKRALQILYSYGVIELDYKSSSIKINTPPRDRYVNRI